MRPTVIRIPAWAHRFLRHLPRWHETAIPGGHAIRKHAHAFLAVYYTFGVSLLETASGFRRLPLAAMVIIPRRQLHGWGATETAAAIVGHFHPAHQAHGIVKVSGAV